jgi:hypothetical protein
LNYSEEDEISNIEFKRMRRMIGKIKVEIPHWIQREYKQTVE